MTARERPDEKDSIAEEDRPNRRPGPQRTLPRLLTVAQIAESSQTSERHIRREIATGKLPVYELSPGIVRVSEEDYLAYLASRRR